MTPSAVRTPLASLSNAPSSPTSPSGSSPQAPIASGCGVCSRCRSQPTVTSTVPSTRTSGGDGIGREDTETVPDETPDLSSLISQIREVLSPYDLVPPSPPSLPASQLPTSSSASTTMGDTERERTTPNLVGQGFSALPASVPMRLQKLMRQYVSSETDFLPYAYFPELGSQVDQGTEAEGEGEGKKVVGCAGYSRNLVDRGNGEFNVLILCWPEGASSQIHDHPGAHCIVRYPTSFLPSPFPFSRRLLSYTLTRDWSCAGQDVERKVERGQVQEGTERRGAGPDFESGVGEGPGLLYARYVLPSPIFSFSSR